MLMCVRVCICLCGACVGGGGACRMCAYMHECVLICSYSCVCVCVRDKMHTFVGLRKCLRLLTQRGAMNNLLLLFWSWEVQFLTDKLIVFP